MGAIFGTPTSEAKRLTGHAVRNATGGLVGSEIFGKAKNPANEIGKSTLIKPSSREVVFGKGGSKKQLKRKKKRPKAKK
jgi:hypothetical protein